jgi:hypothetical protein
MPLPNDPINDHIESLLSLNQSMSGDDSLRQAVLAGTLGVIRRRRRLKKCSMAGALLGCYLAGMATLAFIRPGGENLSRPSDTHVAVNEQSEPGAARTLPPDYAGPPDQKAVYRVASKYEVLCRQADRYLENPENLQLAVNTYSRALKHASAEQRAISPEHDTWLLMALKDAHSKEIKNDNQL